MTKSIRDSARAGFELEPPKIVYHLLSIDYWNQVFGYGHSQGHCKTTILEIKPESYFCLMPANNTGSALDIYNNVN